MALPFFGIGMKMTFSGPVATAEFSSVRFQGKPFNITVIQVNAPTSNAEEAEVEWFYEVLGVKEAVIGRKP